VGYNPNEQRQQAHDEAIHFHTCFGGVDVETASLLAMLANICTLDAAYIAIDEWLLASMMFSLTSPMGGIL